MAALNRQGPGDGFDAPPFVVRSLGPMPYASSLEAMRAFTRGRDASTQDELWLLSHPAVYTLGQAGRREHLLVDRGIELIQTERGGQITYHGPGQLVAYVLVDLKRRGIKIREFVHLLEDALIETLARYNLSALRKLGAPGVYVEWDGELQKIAALGLKVANGCTYHGVSLNVAMDLEPFGWINPCGYPGLKTVDLATLGVQTSVEKVGWELAHALAGLFDRTEGNHEHPVGTEYGSRFG